MIQARLLIVPLSAALLSACVVAPYPARRVVYSQPVAAYSQPVPIDSDEVVVDVAPPAPYVEVVPAIPFTVPSGSAATGAGAVTVTNGCRDAGTGRAPATPGDRTPGFSKVATGACTAAGSGAERAVQSRIASKTAAVVLTACCATCAALAASACSG